MKKTSEYTDYEFVAGLYDHVSAYEERADVKFWIDEARRAGGPVLELGCGTGRVLIPAARAGIDITGLDSSAHMLKVCAEKTAQEPPAVRRRIKLVKGDMRKFNLRRQFALVTIPFRPFQHLVKVKEQMDCLACIRRHLRPKGRLILDLFNPSIPHLADPLKKKEHVDMPEKTLPDGRKIERRARMVSNNYNEQYRDVELIYYVTHPDGRKERLVHRFLMRYLFRYEVEHLLARCGFEVESLHADYDKTPFGATYPGELIFVARKQ